MKRFLDKNSEKDRVTFQGMSTPAKALATCIIFTLTMGMLGALGQIVVHDIIPTFYAENTSKDLTASMDDHGKNVQEDLSAKPPDERGDLFAELTPKKLETKNEPFYKGEQFVWILKWTHIHLFGISMIFIFLGVISYYLDINVRTRTWLIVLPFIGVWVDIAAMWLKGFVSPVFFWLHVTGGGVFGAIFGYVSIRALWEMWIKPVRL